MSRSSKLQAVLFNTETTWGEVATTFGTRLHCIGPVDTSGFKQEKLEPDRIVQYVNEITPGCDGILGGEFKIKLMLTGHGSTTAGAITLNALETVLGNVIGNVAAASSAGTTASGAGTATAPATAAVSGYTAGSLARVGAIADGRGGGQFHAVASHATSVLTLLTALGAAAIAGDVVYNPAVIYPTEHPTASNAVVGTRWLIQGANQQYECHGCYPKSFTISGTNPAEEPSVEITYGVSWWRAVATPVFPSAVPVQTFPHAPVAAGSFFLADFGVATRPVPRIDMRSFSLTVELGIVELKAAGGNNAYQAVLGCARVPSKITGEFVVDAEDATATPAYAAWWSTNTPRHLLYTLSAADGTSVAIYLPWIVPAGDKPTQMDMDGLNRVRCSFRAGTDVSKATDLARSAFRIAIG